jgi:hypothetical protein
LEVRQNRDVTARFLRNHRRYRLTNAILIQQAIRSAAREKLLGIPPGLFTDLHCTLS